MQTWARAKVRRKIKWPKPPSLQEAVFYACMTVLVILTLSDEAQHPSSFTPLRWLADQIFIGVFFSVLTWRMGLTFRKALSTVLFNPFVIPYYAFYLGTFVVTLALHFPFTVIWWWS